MGRIGGVEEFADERTDVRRDGRNVLPEDCEYFVVLLRCYEMAKLRMSSFVDYKRWKRMYRI